VAELRVIELKTGGETPEYRLAWAVEEHQGKRFLHAKVIFPQIVDQRSLSMGAKAVFEIELIDSPKHARRASASKGDQP
jgi:hypothetical protein